MEKNIIEDVVQLPTVFPFPFKPYDIQESFMKEVYKTLELGKIGIFESPTGTGKSLSLICGALKWLNDYEEKQRQEVKLLEAHQNGDLSINPSCSEPDWIVAFSKQQELVEKTKKIMEEQELRLKHETRLQELKKERKPFYNAKRKRDFEFNELFKDAPPEVMDVFKKDEDSDDQIVLEDYISDEDDKKADENSDSEVDDEGHITKIYYCSRTHSQLTQFVREVKKSPYGESVRLVPLASRQTLCINESVKKLKSLSLINDRCLELQKNKKGSKRKETSEPKRKKSSSGCPFYKSVNLDLYKDQVLVEVQDIEQLVTLGKNMKSCPYFGTRFAVPPAQLVVLPYNTLLHESTREACGIKLQGNIVIIDEAHNLLETISNINSIQITGAQLYRAHSQLCQYLERYKSRLKAKNFMYIKQLLYILQAFIKFLGGKIHTSPDIQYSERQETKLLTLNDFLSATLIDNLNLFKIKRYCEKSQIAKKLNGFVEKYQPSITPTVTEEGKETGVLAVTKFLQQLGKKNSEKKIKELSEPVNPNMSIPRFCSPLMYIESFLQVLTAANKDGRIIMHKEGLFSKSSLKFLLLNPAVHFSNVIKEVRALIIAGGTMQPISEFRDQLFTLAGVQQDRILEFCCGHVIPASNILPVILSRGPSGQELDFSFQSRSSSSMMDELGRVLCNLCNVIPGGIVIFFPSYEYERLIYNHWEKGNFLSRISNKKKIFREPKKADQVDQVLNEYTSCIQKCLSVENTSSTTGAILFSVVGGKMSEGINFSDDLGRCVVVVGLPYPNINSPELKEKMDYLNCNMSRSLDGRLPGQIHYENLCMKAVNQSIGRAIRHQNDYACILLLDTRFSRPSIQAKLPGWISTFLKIMPRFGPALASVAKFFNEKKHAEKQCT